MSTRPMTVKQMKRVLKSTSMNDYTISESLFMGKNASMTITTLLIRNIIETALE